MSAILLDSLMLPPGLVWTDRYAWQATAQSLRRTLDGGLVVQYATLLAGRPITLESGDDHGWLTAAQVAALSALAATAGITHTLSIDGEAFAVMFAHHDAPAFAARPLWPGADWYLATLKLFTV